MSEARKPMSIQQQAELAERIATRCLLRDGTTAKETILVLSVDDAEALRFLAARLHRMAPYEDAIRRMVVS